MNPRVAAEGLDADSARDQARLSLTATPSGCQRFDNLLNAGERPRPAMTALDAPERRRAMEWRLSAHSDGVARSRDVTGFTRDQIVADVLDHLHRWRTG